MAEDSLTLTRLREKFAEKILETHSFRGDDTAIIQPDAIVPVATCLRNDPDLDYDFLMDLTAVDCLNLGTAHRFEVVYHFFSLSKKHRVRIKTQLGGRVPKWIPLHRCGLELIGMSAKFGTCLA